MTEKNPISVCVCVCLCDTTPLLVVKATSITSKEHDKGEILTRCCSLYVVDVDVMFLKNTRTRSGEKCVRERGAKRKRRFTREG